MDAFNLVEDWQLTKDDNKFDANDVIEAYFNGKKQGHEDFKALFVEKFHSNLNKSGSLTAKCIAFIKENGFTPVFAKLKVSSFKSYSVLIGVKEEDYNNENFLKIYDHANVLEMEDDSDLFSISFHFAYEGIGFNQKAVINDGYRINFSKL